MAKQMRLWVVGALLLAVCGLVVASNMGFKFVPNLSTGNVHYAVSLPLNNNYTNADSIFQDISASGCTPELVERINPSAGGLSRTSWVGFGSGPQNFTVATGEAYVVQVTSPATWTPAHY